MDKKVRLGLFLTEAELARVTKYSKIIGFSKTGTAAIAMNLGLDAFDQAFDPKNREWLEQVNQTLDQAIKDHAKSNKKEHKSS